MSDADEARPDGTIFIHEQQFITRPILPRGALSIAERVMCALGLPLEEENVTIEHFEFVGPECIGWNPYGTYTGERRPFEVTRWGTVTRYADGAS